MAPTHSGQLTEWQKSVPTRQAIALISTKVGPNAFKHGVISKMLLSSAFQYPTQNAQQIPFYQERRLDS